MLYGCCACMHIDSVVRVLVNQYHGSRAWVEAEVRVLFSKKRMAEEEPKLSPVYQVYSNFSKMGPLLACHSCLILSFCCIHLILTPRPVKRRGMSPQDLPGAPKLIMVIEWMRRRWTNSSNVINRVLIDREGRRE